MENDSTQGIVPDFDLSDFLKIRDENFRRLMGNRALLREKYENSIRMLEIERDSKLQENYALLQQLGIPEEQMPLPPENEEMKKSRLTDGTLRKLSETEIKRVLQEMMEPEKLYTANQLLGFLQTSYKDFSEFYQKHGQDEDDENPPNATNPPFLFGKGKFKWRKYRLAPK
jgi:hypothetical protein